MTPARRYTLVALLGLLLVVNRGGCSLVDRVVGPSGVTSVTYVYEKDDTAVPAAVRAALNKLNRERKIICTIFDDDTTDGTGDTPEQYKAPLKAANEVGLPVLVVMAGDRVVRTVKSPTTEQAVLEAVP